MAPEPGPPPGGPPTVGVWDVVDTATGPGLRRTAGVPPLESVLWSEATRVPGKGAARRVVLLGESAARGHLLDPLFTPARALQWYLDHAAGPGAYQCVDLARTELPLAGLREVVRGVPHLDADIVVLWAGDTWTASVCGSPDRAYGPGVADALRTGGYPAFRAALLTEHLVPAVRAFVADLLRLRDEHGIEPVVVVPEFNLAGWPPSLGVAAVDVPSLPEEDLCAWYRLRDLASAAAERGEWRTVRTLAGRMAELDRGTSPLPGHLLGRAHEAAGEYERARAAYERARDALCGLTLDQPPGTPRIVRDMLLDAVREHRLAAVDLAGVLGRPGAPCLPDPDCFLDSATLSADGINLAMAEVARRIHSAPERTVERPPVADSTRAVSLLLAAIYTAMAGRPADAVRRHLRAAVAAWPGVLEPARALHLLLGGPRGPVWAGPGYRRLIREPNVARALERCADQRPATTDLWTLRQCVAELLGHGPAALAPPPDQAGVDEPVELLDPGTLRGAVPNRTPHRAFLRASTRTTGLVLALPAPTAGELRLIHRHAEGHPDPVVVRLNGRELGEFATAPGWTTARLPVPREATRTGPNRLDVVWPGAAVRHDRRIARDTEALSRGEPPYVLPVFGELYGVTFRPDRPGAAGPP